MVDARARVELQSIHNVWSDHLTNNLLFYTMFLSQLGKYCLNAYPSKYKPCKGFASNVRDLKILLPL